MQSTPHTEVTSKSSSFLLVWQQICQTWTEYKIWPHQISGYTDAHWWDFAHEISQCKGKYHRTLVAIKLKLRYFIGLDYGLLKMKKCRARTWFCASVADLILRFECCKKNLFGTFIFKNVTCILWLSDHFWLEDLKWMLIMCVIKTKMSFKHVSLVQKWLLVLIACFF